MKSISIFPNIYWIGEKKSNNLKEFLIDEPSNIILIIDKKIALLGDFSLVSDYKVIDIIKKINSFRKIDYLIPTKINNNLCNKLELIYKENDNIKLVVSKHAKKIINNKKYKYYLVNQWDKVHLGNNNLIFLFNPLINSRENMIVYNYNNKLLFINDNYYKRIKIQSSITGYINWKDIIINLHNYFNYLQLPYEHNRDGLTDEKLEIDFLLPPSGYIINKSKEVENHSLNIIKLHKKRK